MSAAVDNTLKVSATARDVVEAHTLSQLQAILRAHPEALVLGEGSNVVLGTHIPGVVCLIRNRGITTEMRNGAVEVTAAAGERWHALVRYCLGRGLHGLENLALIPGLVGAAPLQNIGAYGVELAQRLVSLRAVRVSDGAVCTFSAEECGFGYRDSWFKSGGAGQFAVVEITLRLSTQSAPVLDYPDVRNELHALGVSQPTPVDVARAVIRIRRRKLPDPRRIGNVGSFFKNPVISGVQRNALPEAARALEAHRSNAGNWKLSAAQLIDRAGCKGERCGGAAVWPRQPLVLVNLGGATGQDFITLATRIRARVRARFGIQLELEPRVYGIDPEPLD